MNKSMFQKGSVLSKPFAPIKAPVVQEEPEITEKAFFESVTEDAMLESVTKLATSTVRQEAASAVMQWLAGGDASFDELDALLFGFAVDADDVEDDYEPSEGEDEYYGQLMDAAAEFMSQFADDVDIELMAEDEEVAERVFTAVESAIDDLDSDEAIAEFAVRESMMTEAVKKVIRDGKVKLIKKPLRKRRMTAAQRAALKKARRKANTSAAKAARKKSMRQRKSRGM